MRRYKQIQEFNDMNNQTQFSNGSENGVRPKFQLTKRELEVLVLTKDGLKNSEIGQQLGISNKTVENIIRSILQKLSAKNRTEAVVIALKNSLIEI